MVDKVALVTGASSGIGYSLAQELASRGYHLIVCSTGDRLERAAEDMRAYGVDVLELEADLATRKGVEELWDWVKSSGHNLDVACLNAGVGAKGTFKDTDLESELSMVELNCAGMVQLAKYVVRDMAERGTGRILFTSSIAAEMAAPREAVYAATKAFVLSLAQSLRYELEGSGVTVATLQPGPADAEVFHRAGMDNTKAGQEGKSNSTSEDAAREGIDALMSGKDLVYSASMKTKLEGMAAHIIPGKAKAAMREKARPIDSAKERERGKHEADVREVDNHDIKQRETEQRGSGQRRAG
jgi:uncharacterized protein